MIILMSNSEINKRSAERIVNYYNVSNDFCFYPTDLLKLNHSKEPLFVIDLDANNNFQKYIVAVPFAIRLSVRAIASQVSDIYLLVSDVNIKSRLPSFAYHLAKNLNEKSEQPISVHIPTVLDHDVTLVVPPAKLEQWKIYGMSEQHLPENVADYNFAAWQKVKNKTLLWEGDDILQWLNDPQKTYTGIAYSWKE